MRRRSRYTFHMRRWFAIFLIALLPLQFSWGAVASYCGHESGTQAQHLGHHDYQHAVQAEVNAGDDLTNGAAQPASDFDCGHCHTPCCAAPAHAATLPPVAIASHSATPVEGSVRTLAQNPPERPQWVRFA